MTRQNSLNRREFLCTALGVARLFQSCLPATASFVIFSSPSDVTRLSNFPKNLSGAPPPPPTRSKAPGTRTARANPFGTASRTPPAG